MNTSTTSVSKGLKFFVYLASLILVAFPLQSRADLPERGTLALSGMYKVASSSDPFFPAGTNREWFMDFNSGITNEKSSGKVAVSLRQNPNVKVRVMVWQVYPGTNELFLGNQFSEGSRNAVAVAQWRARNQGDSLVLERNGYQIVLNRAAPGEY